MIYPRSWDCMCSVLVSYSFQSIKGSEKFSLASQGLLGWNSGDALSHPGCPFRKLGFCVSAYWKKQLKGHHRKRWVQHMETFLSRMGSSSIMWSSCSCFGLTASFLSWKKPKTKQNKKSREEWWSDQLCSLWVAGTCSGIEAKFAMTNTAPGGTFTKSIIL